MSEKPVVCKVCFDVRCRQGRRGAMFLHETAYIQSEVDAMLALVRKDAQTAAFKSAIEAVRQRADAYDGVSGTTKHEAEQCIAAIEVAALQSLTLDQVKEKKESK